MKVLVKRLQTQKNNRNNINNNMITKIQPSKFFTSDVKEVRSGVVSIEFPEDIVNHLKMKGSKAHWVVTNGVLQVSGDEAAVEMPLLVYSEFGNVSRS